MTSTHLSICTLSRRTSYTCENLQGATQQQKLLIAAALKRAMVLSVSLAEEGNMHLRKRLLSSGREFSPALHPACLGVACSRTFHECGKFGRSLQMHKIHACSEYIISRCISSNAS